MGTLGMQKTGVWVGEYLQKTSTMYYLAEVYKEAEQGRGQVASKVADLQGQGIGILLPVKFSLDRMCNNRINHTGRAVVPPVASMDGIFTRVEVSAYKEHKPYKVHTYLWQVVGYPALLYGTIGTSDKCGRIRETGDLVVILDSGDRLKVWVFKGDAVPFNNGLPTGLQRAIAYLKDAGVV